jgi:soluble lytic murein transglycosylase-like protein
MRISSLIRVVAFTVSLLAMGQSHATDACFASAAEQFSVPEQVLRAIAHVESGGNPNAISRNFDGTKNFGLMQIHELWLPRLKQQFELTKLSLLEPCNNIRVGALILAENLHRYNNDLWRAVGFYNAKSPAPQNRYIRKVQAALLLAVKDDEDKYESYY